MLLRKQPREDSDLLIGLLLKLAPIRGEESGHRRGQVRAWQQDMLAEPREGDLIQRARRRPMRSTPEGGELLDEMQRLIESIRVQEELRFDVQGQAVALATNPGQRDRVAVNERKVRPA